MRTQAVGEIPDGADHVVCGFGIDQRVRAKFFGAVEAFLD
jgi:hypothetical protein